MEDLVKSPAEQRLEYLSSLPLGKLAQEQHAEEEAGTFDEPTKGLFSALTENRLNQEIENLSTLPSKAMVRAFEAGVRDGVYGEDFEPVVKSLFNIKKKEELAKSTSEKVGEFAAAAGGAFASELASPFTEQESQIVAPFVRGAAKSIRDVVRSTGFTGATPQEQELAWNRLASGAELGTKETVGLIRDAFDSSDEAAYAEKGDAAVDEVFNARRSQAKSLEDAARGAGYVVTKGGIAAPVQLDEQSRRDVQDMSGVLDATGVPLTIATGGFAIGSKGIVRTAVGAAKRVGMEGLAEGIEKVGVRAGKILESGPRRKILGTPLETAEAAIERAAQTAGPIRNARVAMGDATVKLGEAITNAASKLPAANTSGALAAGAVLYGGGDPQEALSAGLSALIGRKLVGSRMGLRLVGDVVEGTGNLMRRPYPAPFANAQQAVNEFMYQYRPIKSALMGSAFGATEAGALALGADSPEEAGQLVGGMGALGGISAGVGTVKAFGRDQLIKSATGTGAKPSTVAVEVKPLGFNAEADRINAETLKKMTPAGSVFMKLAREMLPDQHVYFAMTGDEAQNIFTSVTGQATDVRNANGVQIKAPDGKQLVIIRPAGSGVGITGEGGGHEVTHALHQIGLADPKQRGYWLEVERAADKALSDPEVFQQVKDAYQSKMPAGTEMTPEQVRNEFIAEHGSVALSGLPAGKLGGSPSVAKTLYSALFRLAENAGLRKSGANRLGEGPVTSSTLPYTPSFNLVDSLEHAIKAASLEGSDLVPDSSVPDPVAVNPLQPSGPLTKGTTVPVRPATEPVFSGGEGILNPIPTSLATDQSLRASTPPPQARPEATAPETAPAIAEVTPQGAIRGQEVQAARTNTEAALSADDIALVQKIESDPAKQPVLERVVSFVKSLGGQRVGLPIVEASINQDGVVRSKRLAPYEIDRSSPDKPVVISVDLDRANYNAKLLFDWAAEKGTPERFGYEGINDPKFTQDLQTYLRNQAEGRRGSGETLTAEGIPPATGEAFGKLTRDQELFFNTIMGQTPPKALTTRSLGAIARINATARASGIEPRTTETGSVEPNSLRDSLRSEGAPIDRIGEDPDPTRRQSNPKDRNSVITRTRLQDFVDFKPTSQSVSQPNIRAIEASFMPSASGQPVPAEAVSKRSSNENIRSIAKSYVEKEKLPYQPHDTAIPVREETAKRIADLYDKAVDSPNDPAVKKAYTALANETLKQWKEFEAAGYKAELWTGEGQPYADSAAMMKDVRDNKHIYYFGTEGGFGAGGITPEMRSNPMLATSGVDFVGAKNVPVNDVFRVVHDIVGHGAHGYEFGPKGEFNAYLEHSRMFSPEAKPALAAETLAQNSWVNYGPHLRKADGSLPKKGEAGFIPAAERRFADQKNIVIPDSILKEVDAYASEASAASKGMNADTIEAQSLKASEAVENAVPKAPSEAQLMPSLAKAKVKGEDVQFKLAKPLKGAIGGVLEGVHFSSKSLAEIDPKKSFGKGAATSTDMQGEPKVFFYKKNTAYEAPISARSNVYEVKIDGNSIYDYNEDALGVRSIVNREKRDLALKNAGFKGFYVETPGFDAIAIFDKIGVKESSHESVMSREQLQDAGKLAISPEEAASRQASEAANAEESKGAELRLAKAKEQVLASKGYELAKERIAKEVGDDYSFEYNDRLDTWADEQAAKKAALAPIQAVSTGKKAAAKLTKEAVAQFMPAGETKLEDYVGRNVFALPADRLAVGKVSVGPKEGRVEIAKEAQGGRGFPTLFDGRGWAFSSEGTANSFLRRVGESAAGEKTALVAISALSEKNALNSPFGQLAVVTAYEAAVNAGVVKSKAMDTTVKEMFERASGSAMSQAKLLKSKGKPFDSVLETAKKFKSVKSLADFRALVENGKINFTEMGFLRPQLDAKTTKVSGSAREAANVDSLTIARDISDTSLHGLPNFSLVALLEIPVEQKPSNDKLHGSYPWSVGGKLLGFFPEAYDLNYLTSDQRIKNKQGTITAQPMQTVLPSLDKMKVSADNPNPIEALKNAKVSRLSSK